jgi:hypothetical protein
MEHIGKSPFSRGIYLSIYLSIEPSTHLSIDPSIHLSIYLFVSYRIASHPIVSYFIMGICIVFWTNLLDRPWPIPFLDLRCSEVTTSTPAASAVLAPAMLRRMKPILRHDLNDFIRFFWIGFPWTLGES